MKAPVTPEAAAETIQTDLGRVEVARAGAGPPVLGIHGTPGGSDSTIVMGRFLAQAGFEVIAPSRPGYLGTPLDHRGAIDGQADLLAALLDALGHARAGVLTWSGGGPSGYRLAVRHPDRVSALVPFAALSHDYQVPDDDLETRLFMKTRPGNWVLRFLAAHAPKSAVSATLGAEGDLTHDEVAELTARVLEDPDERDVVLTMTRVVGDRAHRRAGMEADFASFAAIATLELERVAAPTLLVHGTADADVAPEYSDYAQARIPDVERIDMDRGTHLCLFAHPDARAVQARVAAHLRAGV
jgi:pimeloyl-ACP methyl ester carboxylesterase